MTQQQNIFGACQKIQQLASAIDQPIVTELPCRELVGALIFVMVGTRPDIAFAVSSSLTIFQRLVHYTGNRHFDALVIWWELLSLVSSWVLVARRNWCPTQIVIGLVTQQRVYSTSFIRRASLICSTKFL